MFGGLNATGGVTNQTWVLHHSTWKLSTAAVAPAPRKYPFMAENTSSHRVYLFGGMDSSSTTIYHDLWEYLGGNWSKVKTTFGPSNSSSLPRLDPTQFVFDKQYSTFLMEGIYQNSSTHRYITGDWLLENSTWTPVTLTGSSAGGFWVWDSDRGGLLAYNPCFGASCIPATSLLVNTTWALLNNSRSPGDNVPTLTYEPSVGAVLYSPNGIKNTGSAAWYTTFVLGAHGSWTEVNSTLVPGPGCCGQMTYDARDKVDLLYSGYINALFTSYGYPSNATLVFNGSAWSVVPTPAGLGQIYYGSMTYDARDRYALMIGGVGGSGSQLWAFYKLGWHQITPTANPPSLYWAGLTYDAHDGYVVYFGGASNPTPTNSTWSYYNGNWTLVHPKTSPTARQGMGMAYSPKTQTVILFGGQNSASRLLNDTWSYQNGSWTNITSSAGPAPPARWQTNLIYDPAANGLLLFGGRIGSQGLSDTWLFSGGRWSNVTGSIGTTPSARAGDVMAYSPTLHSVIMFGGYYTNDDAAFWQWS